MNTDVLTGEPIEESQQVDEQVQDGEGQNESQGETTTPNTNEKHVPLAALEAERTGRRDWKEKALRFEGELKAMREMSQPRQVQEEQVERDPFVVMNERMINERFNTSELIARQAHPDIDEKIEAFKEALQANPAIYQQMQNQAHPWEFAYKEGARLLLAKEMGDDPTTYRQKLEAEIRAKVLAELGQGESNQSNPKAVLPKSLAGFRSSAARSAGTFTGPTPFDQIINS